MNSSETICNLCGHDNFAVLEEDERPFMVLKCKRCSLIFVHPFPDDGQLRGHYDEAYYYDWIHSREKSRMDMWARRLNRLEAFARKGRLLDVGCGNGEFLRLAHEKGWQVAGTEISPYASRYVAGELGAEIFCGELTDARYPDRYFDGVTLWHVLEHVKDPMSYLMEIHRILKPSGRLILAVPNARDLIMQAAYRIIKGRRLKRFSAEDREIHFYHFCSETITAYLQKANFQCLRLGPDFGIVETSKKMVNLVGVIPFYLAGIRIFNSFEVHAAPIHGG